MRTWRVKFGGQPGAYKVYYVQAGNVLDAIRFAYNQHEPTKLAPYDVTRVEVVEADGDIVN